MLQALLADDDPNYRIEEVVCVASGCTDGTVRILSEAQSSDARVRVIVQPHREGKASALFAGLQAVRRDAILVENADTVPGPGSISALLAPLRDPQVGLVTCRPVPVGDPTNFAEQLGVTLWAFHDAVAQGRPKAGEAFAFRRIPVDLPSDIEDDDTFVQAFLEAHGGRSVYARSAVVFNRVPSSIWDLVRQRYRIDRQQVGLYQRRGVGTSTWSPRDLIPACARFLRANPGAGPSLVVLAGLETGARLAALTSRLLDPRPVRSWNPIGSTKGPIMGTDGSPAGSAAAGLARR